MTVEDYQKLGDTGAAKARHWGKVINCYSAVDAFFPACGLFDLTEGIYHGNSETPLEQAQANQHEYLMDEVQCGPGRRVLDIGCGYGTLLERIQQRGAEAVGVTLSAKQAKHCRRRKLKTYVLDYRAIPSGWNRTFDGVIANGSIEHFVQPTDVVAGKADEVYRHLFATVHRLIDPNSAARRFVTTTLHVIRKPADPRNLLKSPFAFSSGSDNFHWAVLERGWGGYYPEVGQLRRCAEGYFDLIQEVDGTADYRLTSEEWLRKVRRALRSPRVVKIILRSLPVLTHSPRQFSTLLLGFLVSKSWNWQFEPPKPPTQLLRQTWAYRGRP
ncbi:MAG: class I SAM-dependent methyltransferase [Deltaproteobacteria bacterium]|nr:class I SAM-dependent methyltransferase [Deltaproteobacteria bacterium]